MPKPGMREGKGKGGLSCNKDGVGDEQNQAKDRTPIIGEDRSLEIW